MPGFTTQIGELCEFDLNRIPKADRTGLLCGDELPDIYSQAGSISASGISICEAIAPQGLSCLEASPEPEGFYWIRRPVPCKRTPYDVNQVMFQVIGDMRVVLGSIGLLSMRRVKK